MNITKLDLERAIDDLSLSAVLDALAEICYDKENHIREMWQDDGLANLWFERAKLIEKVSYYAQD